jgi:hypothetical protein
LLLIVDLLPQPFNFLLLVLKGLLVTLLSGLFHLPLGLLHFVLVLLVLLLIEPELAPLSLFIELLAFPLLTPVLLLPGLALLVMLALALLVLLALAAALAVLARGVRDAVFVPVFLHLLYIFNSLPLYTQKL